MKHEADFSGPTLIKETSSNTDKNTTKEKTTNGRKPKSSRWLKKN